MVYTFFEVLMICLIFQFLRASYALSTRYCKQKQKACSAVIFHILQFFVFDSTLPWRSHEVPPYCLALFLFCDPADMEAKILICVLFNQLPNVATPTMIQVPKTQTVILNRTSNLWCPVEGAPAPYIVWRKNGVVVQNSTSVRYQLVAAEKNVNYSCEVRRDNNVSRREISLSIEGEFISYTSVMELYQFSIVCLNVYYLINLFASC